MKRSAIPKLGMSSIALTLLASMGAPASMAMDAASADVSMHAAHGAGHVARPALAPQAISASESGGFTRGQPLNDPPKIKSRNGKLALTLTARRARVRISGKLVNARVYSASANGKVYPAAYMPPVLEVQPGDNLRVSLVNKLGEPTNLHTHGFFISPAGNQDNIFVDLPGGKTFMYNYFIPQDISPGLYWYHPHYHTLVEEQVFGGLAGLLYVRGLEKLLPANLQGITERFMGLKDFQLNDGNSIPANNIDSGAATNRTINGRIQPVISLQAGETQLWHLGNIGADIWYDLELAGLTLTVIAEDANPLDKPLTTDHLLMAPAKRYDVLVQAQKPGNYQLITRAMTTGPDGDDYPEALMAKVKVTGTEKAPVALPTTIQALDDLSGETIARQRIFDLTENNDIGQFFINQRMFDPNQVDATPVIGTVEEWIFRNNTHELHPIHLHVNDAQIVSINGVTQQARSWVDTIPIPYIYKDGSGNDVPGEVVMRFRFRRFMGPYVFHCHILGHEDNGMMSIINVTSPGSE